MGSDMYGMAAVNACTALKARLDEVRRLEKKKRIPPSSATHSPFLPISGMDGDPSFREVVGQAYFQRKNLTEHGFHKVPVHGFNFETGEVSEGENGRV